MSRIEAIIVGLFVGIACPLLTSVTFWWSSALLHMRVPGIPLTVVIVSASTGLTLGLLFDVLFLRRWVRGFYGANIGLMIVLYLGLSIVAVAFFMGLPVGTIALGATAGLYMGRRASHGGADSSRAALPLRKTAIVTATVTAAAALPIGILALREQDIVAMLERWSGISETHLQGGIGLALIVFLCGLLFLIQYWLCRKAGLLALDMGRSHARHRGAGSPAAHRD